MNTNISREIFKSALVYLQYLIYKEIDIREFFLTTTKYQNYCEHAKSSINKR